MQKTLNLKISKMKSINIIIALITLAYATISAKAQVNSDTIKVFYKGKKFAIPTSIEAEEEESNKTLKFDDTLKKRTVTIKVKVTRKDDIESIFGDSSSNKQKIIKAIKERNDKTKRKHLIETDYLTGFLIGTANIITENNINSKATLKPMAFKSVNFSAELLRIDMNLYKNQIRLKTGIGINSYMMKFNTPSNVYYIDGAGHLNNYKDTIKNVKKNRYDVSYYTVPIALEYHDKKDKFKISAGVEFGFFNEVHNTRKGKLTDGNFKEKRDNVELKINPSQINSLLKIGYEDLSLYARYSFTNIFKNDAFASGQNPNQKFIAIGFSITGF